MDLSFKLIEHNSNDWKEAVRLRELVLRDPAVNPFTPEELEEESKHLHTVAILGELIVGGAVLVPEKDKFKMQRVFVIEEQRNQNIGSQLMRFCEEIAHQKGIATIYCHARDKAVKFYQNNGYHSKGDYFLEDDIPHLLMFKVL